MAGEHGFPQWYRAPIWGARFLVARFSAKKGVGAGAELTDKMLLAAHVPAFGWKRSPFINLGQQVRLWRQVANLDPPKLAAAIVLQMETVARRV